jgi:hypothetical protein
LPHNSPPDAPQENALSLSGLIGAINSQVEPSPSYEKTAFGEAIASKLARKYSF